MKKIVIFLILLLGFNFVFGYEIVSNVKIPLSFVGSAYGNYYDENNNFKTFPDGYPIALYQPDDNSVIDVIELRRRSENFVSLISPGFSDRYIDYVDVIEVEFINSNTLKFKRILARWDFTNPDLPRLYCGSYNWWSGYSNCYITGSGVFEFKYLTDNPYIQHNNYILFRLISGNDIRFVYGWDNFSAVNNLLNFYGSTKIYTQLVFPSGYNFNVDDYNNNLVFKIYSVNEFNNISSFKLDVIDNFTGQILYNSGIKTANISITPFQLEEKTLYLPDYDIDLKQVFTDLKDNFKTNLKLRLTLYLTGSGGQAVIRDEVVLVLQGFQVIGQTYQDWYNSIISSFGLSDATPTPIFQKAGELIDRIFSFTTLPTFNLENKGKDLAEKFNYFYSYLKAISFISYFLLVILAFFTFRIAIRFIKLIFLR